MLIRYSTDVQLIYKVLKPLQCTLNLIERSFKITFFASFWSKKSHKSLAKFGTEKEKDAMIYCTFALSMRAAKEIKYCKPHDMLLSDAKRMIWYIRATSKLQTLTQWPSLTHSFPFPALGSLNVGGLLFDLTWALKDENVLWLSTPTA